MTTDEREVLARRRQLRKGDPLGTDEIDRRIQQTPELHRLVATDRPQPIGGEIQALLDDLKSFGDDEQKAA